MRILLDRIERRNRHAEIILRPELVVRASTDPDARDPARSRPEEAV